MQFIEGSNDDEVIADVYCIEEITIGMLLLS